MEILLSTLIIFLLFSLAYMTFFSISRTTVDMRKSMRTSEILLRSLNKFYQESKGLLYEKDSEFSFETKEVSFKYMDKDMLYPSLVKYVVEPTNDGDSLVRQQKNLLTDYLFTIPVLEECESINFMFHNGESWEYVLSEEEKLVAIAIEIDYAGNKLFFPVKLPENEKKISKK